ncbi:MAG: DUF5916 domain-containing protein [Gemmatimonadota bacterium]|nr:carbohydrate binding family 9 domain-containing protein [Gemmatimonadota bacterium]
MRTRTSLLPLLVVVLAPASLTAQAGGPSAAATDRPSMPATRVEGSIRVDGILDEAVWAEAPSFRGFIQKEPVEGAPALNDSEVWIVYDDEAVYVGARLYDSAPSSIARNMIRRDSEYNGQFDYFEVMFDPNLDRRTGYRFRVSAANVQTDRYLFDDGGEDQAWDAVWSSGVTIAPDGWHVEMRIPLSQMRYEQRDGVQTWGINFGRRRAADNELTRFALESKLQPGRVSQFGLLEGIRVASAPRRVELRPYVLTRARHQPTVDGNPFVDPSAFGGQVGVDLRYGLGSQFTLDATLNPDFGQVEVDPAVINLTAFEVFFEERRPFFVEDARIFDFDLSGGGNRVFYSRRIGRAPQGSAPPGADFVDVPESATILAAAKLTGRTQRGLSIGAMAALTGRETGQAFFTDTRSTERFVAEPRGVEGVVRVSQDLNGGLSRVGGLFTALQRDLPGDGSLDDLPTQAFGGGVDFEHNWSERTWALWGFAAGSHVRGDSLALLRVQRSSNHYLQRPDLDWSTLDADRTSLTGAEWRLQFEKRRGRWTGALWGAQVTSGFEVNDLGFSRSRERLDGGARVSLQDVIPGAWFRNWSVTASTFHNWSHEALRHPLEWGSWRGAHTAGSFSLSGNVTLNNFWTVNASSRYNPENMSRVATRGGPRMREPALWGGSLGIRTDNRRAVTLAPRIDVSKGLEDSMEALAVSASLSLQPSSQLQIELEPAFERSRQAAQYVLTTAVLPWAPTYGNRYLFADLDQRTVSMETRLNWTFTPQLTLQLFAQPLLSAADYVRYKQLAASETFAFDAFAEGTARVGTTGTLCEGGRTCEDADHRRYVDLDGDGRSDLDFRDRDFNLRSLRANAVLRWEYRPGSTLFFVWQRSQTELVDTGDFDFGRDVRALGRAAADDTFIVKMNLWLSL